MKFLPSAKRRSRSQTHMSKKARRSLFPQCKTSIVYNAGSVEDSALQFECSMGFSAIADRMVSPPSLSRDRKWSYLTKYTHSMIHGSALRRQSCNYTFTGCNRLRICFHLLNWGLLCWYKRLYSLSKLRNKPNHASCKNISCGIANRSANASNNFHEFFGSRLEISCCV